MLSGKHEPELVPAALGSYVPLPVDDVPVPVAVEELLPVPPIILPPIIEFMSNIPLIQIQSFKTISDVRNCVKKSSYL